MILILYNVDFENGEQTKFEFYGPLFFEISIFKLILIFKFQNVSCALSFEVKHSKIF